MGLFDIHAHRTARRHDANARSCRAVGWVLGVLALLPASARSAELAARGPAGCPDARELTFRVERRIGMPLAQAAPLQFDVSMERRAADHHARIDVSPGGQRRELVASDCETLADAIGVAVSLALGTVETAPSPSSATEETGMGENATPPVVSEAPVVAPGSGAHVRDGASEPGGAEREASNAAAFPFPEASLSVSLLGDAGSLPSPAFGVTLGAEAAWRRMELHLRGTLLLEQQAWVESASRERAGAKLELWTVGALGCTSTSAGERTLTPLACLGLEVGRLTGVGTDVTAPRRGSAFWAAPVVQLGAIWPVPGSAFRLEVALLGAAPLNRDEFSLRQIGAVHRPPSIIGRLSIGVGLDL